jgi:hypothetical protein
MESGSSKHILQLLRRRRTHQAEVHRRRTPRCRHGAQTPPIAVPAEEVFLWQVLTTASQAPAVNPHAMLEQLSRQGVQQQSDLTSGARVAQLQADVAQSNRRDMLRLILTSTIPSRAVSGSRHELPSTRAHLRAGISLHLLHPRYSMILGQHSGPGPRTWTGVDATVSDGCWSYC